MSLRNAAEASSDVTSLSTTAQAQTLDIVQVVATSSAVLEPLTIAAIIDAVHSLSGVVNMTANHGAQLLAVTGAATNRTTQSVAQTTGDQLLGIISNVFYGRIRRVYMRTRLVELLKTF
jgi:hypothetical protein